MLEKSPTHLVEIYLVKEIRLGVRRSYVSTRFCVSIGLHFHPARLSWRPTAEKMVVTSEVPPDPEFLGFAEDSVIYNERSPWVRDLLLF